MQLHPGQDPARAPTLCRQSWHSIASTLQELMQLLSLFRCFFISQTFLERKTMRKFPVSVRQQRGYNFFACVFYFCTAFCKPVWI